MGQQAMQEETRKLPQLPVEGIKGFITHLKKNQETTVEELLKPYKAFEGELRKIYAQQPNHDAVQDGGVNLVPIFEGIEGDLKVRARKLNQETEAEKEKFIMPLKEEDRLADGAPAVVSSFQEFQQNFNLFSESALADLDWSNVVAAGSAVTTALLPVPEKWRGSKRSLREYYHQFLAPASDVDLFIYGLSEEKALEKIKQIERSIRDSILHETTTIRTKNAITIASQYPTRHVQIVLRLYDSISQIITGFDVDCACVAYTGTQVYAAPRAVAAFVTQCNTIDLTRRSPSYENRLSKYSHRGFEAHWPLLDRSRIDPTIFERSFGRTQGLARLLILEKLPKSADRDSYMDQRRSERGRPAIHRAYRHPGRMMGNIKDQEEDEVAEWVEDEEIASYHTMTVPYGVKYNAAKINRLLYAKDLLLNAEWNQDKDRHVHLHRHPCFFGTAEEILQDCCGYCPEPKTDEELKIAEDEAKNNVSGPLRFLKDDPGRQEIGSFNPITDDEWTTMAYVGDTARLCQAIIDKDLEHVEDWCAQEGVDINRRDYTGRTPLHLAAMASDVKIVKCLIDHGARLIARLVDGRTALHIAAARGDTAMVKALMDKSISNEEEEEIKETAKRSAQKTTRVSGDNEGGSISNGAAVEEDADLDSETSSVELGNAYTDESDSMTMGSFVKIDNEAKSNDGVPEDSLDDPDVYDINVIAWDHGLSPLHLAILNAHLDIIELLVSEYGADVLLPVKLVNPGTSVAKAAIMTMVLALSLPSEEAKSVIKLLLKLGATSAQADMNYFTCFHYIVASDNSDLFDLVLSHDRPAALSIINNIGSSGYSFDSPITTTISKGQTEMVKKLLQHGAQAAVLFENWIKHYISKNSYARRSSVEQNMDQFRRSVVQPVVGAAIKESGTIVEDLLGHGADPNTLESNAWSVLKYGSSTYRVAESLLDIIRKKIAALTDYKPEMDHVLPTKPFTLQDENIYTSGLKESTYQYWSAFKDYQYAKEINERDWKLYKKALEESQEQEGISEKKDAISRILQELKQAETCLVSAGAKTFSELHPEIPVPDRNHTHRGYIYESAKPQPHETRFTFAVSDLTENQRTAYLKLFQAAWDGDIEIIKSLTLAPYELETGQFNPPLRIAVQDGNGFSPFSLAVLRGHRDIALKIVEICMAQYRKEDTGRRKFNIRSYDNIRCYESDDEYDSDYDSDEEHDLPITSNLVSDKYTVDNLGEVASTVKSDILPLQMIEWECYTERIIETKEKYQARCSILVHSINANDMDLFNFMLHLCAKQQACLADDEDAQKCYTVKGAAFTQALRLGRTQMLAEMIQSTGAGIPINELIKTSGVELKFKPKFYQGLTVGGKKHAEWAAAPGGMVEVNEIKTPPLLQAIEAGSIDSVEWFMSDAPMRRYEEFAERNKNDKRIKTLVSTDEGFNKTVASWLDSNSGLALHCAILHISKETGDSLNRLNLIKHLLSVSPHLLEKKSAEGWTPLQVACSILDPDVISYLISIGANQHSRDKLGRNLMHSLLSQLGLQNNDNPDNLRKLFDMFDKKALKIMLCERSSVVPGAATPLATWMRNDNNCDRWPHVIKILSEYSTGEELEMINGEGDLPLHVAVRKQWTTATNILLSLNPSLLYRENATGRTPLEVSHDAFVASCTDKPPPLSCNYRYTPNNDDLESIVKRSPKTFIPTKPSNCANPAKEIYDQCTKMDKDLRDASVESQLKRKRRLVSLFEANEVARRLAGRDIGKGSVVVNGHRMDEGKPDIVSQLLASFSSRTLR